MRARELFGFMIERESIRLRRETGRPWPWTQDEILKTYKFTNVFREHDKTSRLLREEFYNPNRQASKQEILMNAALFRYFGTVEFARAVGWQSFYDFAFDHIQSTASDRLRKGERVFTGAYVITNQGIAAPKEDVVVNHFLAPLHAQAHRIVDSVQMTRSWKNAVGLMGAIPGFGGTGFMAKEILLDTTYTNFWGGDFRDGKTLPVDWWEWTPVGPGGLRGAARVLGAARVTSARAMGLIEELSDVQADYWPAAWPKLAPHDIQFQLCEFDKYERTKNGEGRPRSRYRP